MAELQSTLTTLLAGNVAGGEYAFAITDLQTGETVGIGLARPHYTGCIANFFVILQATIDVQNERTEESLVGDLISRTIYSSNPVTARDLYRIAGDGDVVAGVQRVADLIEEIKMTRSSIIHRSMRITRSASIPTTGPPRLTPIVHSPRSTAATWLPRSGGTTCSPRWPR